MALRYRNQLLYEFLSPGKRLELAFEITEFDREIRKEKLRREHPEWCELEVVNEIIRHAFRVKSEPISEGLEKHMQQRVKEWRVRQAAEPAQIPAPPGAIGNSPARS
jgi:hypothetical protein